MNTAEHPQAAPIRFLSLPEVESLTGISKTCIYASIKAGTFPRPVKASKRARRWIESEIQAWMRARVEERDKAA